MRLSGVTHIALLLWPTVAFGQALTEPDATLPAASDTLSIDEPILDTPTPAFPPNTTLSERALLRVPEPTLAPFPRRTSPSGAWEPGALSAPTVDLRLPELPAFTPDARAALRTSPDRPPVPTPLIRRPLRNIALPADALDFTFRTAYGGDYFASVTFGLQTELRYNDNINGLPGDRAIADTILDILPIVRLNIGERPSNRLEERLESQYYLELLYAPTEHILLDAGTSRLLHRVFLEAGRATERSRISLNLEYHENVGEGGDASPEETSTVFTLSPSFEYNLSAKTLLYLRGEFIRNLVEGGVADRSEYSADLGFEVETSAKTAVGLGTEFGYVDFDTAEFGHQTYWQLYGAWAWRPSEKLSMRVRAGVEIREFDINPPEDDEVSPVVLATLSWVPSERTRVDLGFQVRNQPSIVEAGTLFREVTFGLEARHDFAYNLYLRGEAEITYRDYQSGREELEWTIRPAIGYLSVSGSLFNSLNVELFYEYRRQNGNSEELDFDRNQVGIQATVYF